MRYVEPVLREQRFVQADLVFDRADRLRRAERSDDQSRGVAGERPQDDEREDRGSEDPA